MYYSVSVVKVHVKFRGYEGEQVHEKSDYDFVIRADLPYKAAAAANAQTSVLENKESVKIDSVVQAKGQTDEILPSERSEEGWKRSVESLMLKIKS